MNRLLGLIIAAIIALLIAGGASYFAVVSQNSGAGTTPGNVYGSVSP